MIFKKSDCPNMRLAGIDILHLVFLLHNFIIFFLPKYYLPNVYYRSTLIYLLFLPREWRDSNSKNRNVCLRKSHSDYLRKNNSSSFYPKLLFLYKNLIKIKWKI